MPTTSQNVTWIALQTGWNRDGERGILPLYNEACNILLQEESEQTVKLTDSTGDIPTFDTRDTVYKYNLPADIWHVSRILIATPIDNNYDLYVLTNYGFEENLQKPIDFEYFAGRKYLRFQQCRTFDRTPSSACYVVFTVNPGATTNTFCYIGYKLPTQITTERIQTAIPDRLHLSHLLPATILLIEAFQTGKFVEAREYIENKIKPDMWAKMNAGEQGMSGHVTRRGF